ncbi:methionyl-tRNA formyltransferase [Flammeovirga kamogawensis]|uniref:Methionyl-tRNA formyltransferase n=1 Tax=Flammeovirga kamogawensis TaxID=373891 RepID=A0ABX8GS27_9BACT|nr:methionyl-tRNA formyltransferase [Flammeovirga kamogawensis]MBB6461492.1 methionyl-tRNA formyltransferase [Flammeovirga kamogawensis]QWG06384.1 methionyl-tRNA formyltransferase [Flammeovirga kamogawensis]TRX68213.1 methionyl-tRNA formyltransferase [Flammeovirga kamogawensis]
MEKNLKIVFMGTPDFAVPSLQVLVENGYNVVGVITAPDKPAGRGRKLQSSPVKQYAESVGLHIMQPTNLKNAAFQQELKELEVDLQIVVAFRMLPEAVWDMPRIGTFNLHGSLLPDYRGAAPINWAIINGEKVTGVTTFFLQHEIDTGDIILQQEEPILEEDTVGDVYGRLMQVGGKLVLKTVQLVEQGDYKTTPQKIVGEPKMAPKIFKETCKVDFSKDTETVYNFIRGLSPYPAAWTEIQGKTYKLFKVSKVNDDTLEANEDGFVTDNKSFFYIKTADGFISVDEWQMQGKKRMEVKAFLLGTKF